jgi:hypothetical protein
MPGEFVLRRQVVSAVGAQNLQRLNAGGDLPDGAVVVGVGAGRDEGVHRRAAGR